MKTFIHPKSGDIRVKKIYCVLPYRIGVTSYWLGAIYVKQIFREDYVDRGWDTVKLATEDEYNRFKSLNKKFITLSEYNAVN